MGRSSRYLACARIHGYAVSFNAVCFCAFSPGSDPQFWDWIMGTDKEFRAYEKKQLEVQK
jgi:hypothetical protein